MLFYNNYGPAPISGTTCHFPSNFSFILISRVVKSPPPTLPFVSIMVFQSINPKQNMDWDSTDIKHVTLYASHWDNINTKPVSNPTCLTDTIYIFVLIHSYFNSIYTDNLGLVGFNVMKWYIQLLLSVGLLVCCVSHTTECMGVLSPMREHHMSCTSLGLCTTYSLSLMGMTLKRAVSINIPNSIHLIRVQFGAFIDSPFDS